MVFSTLKEMLRKHATWFGMQWDTYAYCNTPHESTGEKLMDGRDCRGPTEAALLPSSPVDVEDYHEEMAVAHNAVTVGDHKEV